MRIIGDGSAFSDKPEYQRGIATARANNAKIFEMLKNQNSPEEQARMEKVLKAGKQNREVARTEYEPVVKAAAAATPEQKQATANALEMLSKATGRKQQQEEQQ